MEAILIFSTCSGMRNLRCLNFNSGTPAFLLYHLGPPFFFFLSLPHPVPPLSIFVIHLISLLFIYSTLTVTLTTLFILLPRSRCINPLSALSQSPFCPLALLLSCPMPQFFTLLHFPIFPISLFPYTLLPCPLLFFTLTGSSALYS